MAPDRSVKPVSFVRKYRCQRCFDVRVKRLGVILGANRTTGVTLEAIARFSNAFAASHTCEIGHRLSNESLEGLVLHELLIELGIVLQQRADDAHQGRI